MKALRFFLSIAITLFVMTCIGHLYAALCSTLGISVYYQAAWALGIVIVGLVASVFGKIDMYEYGPFNTLLFLLTCSIGSFPVFEKQEISAAIQAGAVHPGQILAIMLIGLVGCIACCSHIEGVLEDDFQMKPRPKPIVPTGTAKKESRSSGPISL
jgi:Zn-dependent protease